jgi:TRAP-type C4-dicarboxylate transport system permease small subunit
VNVGSATGPEIDNAGSWLGRLARLLALGGGLLLLGIAVLVTVSVLKRATTGEGINGDFELVQTAAAIVAFACFPLCVAVRGNIAVDTFTTRAPAGFNRALDALWDIVFAVICAVLSWRLAVGAMDQLKSGTTLMMSGITNWWAIALCSGLAGVLSLTALVVGVRLLRGRS